MTNDIYVLSKTRHVVLEVLGTAQRLVDSLEQRFPEWNSLPHKKTKEPRGNVLSLNPGLSEPS